MIDLKLNILSLTQISKFHLAEVYEKLMPLRMNQTWRETWQKPWFFNLTTTSLAQRQEKHAKRVFILAGCPIFPGSWALWCCRLRGLTQVLKHLSHIYIHPLQRGGSEVRPNYWHAKERREGLGNSALWCCATLTPASCVLHAHGGHLIHAFNAFVVMDEVW